MGFEHALEALTIAHGPFGRRRRRSHLNIRTREESVEQYSALPLALHSRPLGSRSVSDHAVDGVQPRSDARPALRSGRGLDATHETHATPDRAHVARPLNALHVEVSQMLYEQREKSIEQRGEFEEELIGSGGTSLEACAPSKLVSELLSEGVGRCDNVLDPQQADALKTFVRDALIKAERDTSKGKFTETQASPRCF